MNRAKIDGRKRDSLGNKPICLTCKYCEACGFLFDAIEETGTATVAWTGACEYWQEWPKVVEVLR